MCLPLRSSQVCVSYDAAGLHGRRILLGVAFFGPGAATDGDVEELLGIADGLGGDLVLDLRERPLDFISGILAQRTKNDVFTTTEFLCFIDAFTENHLLSEETAANGILAGLLLRVEQHRYYPFQNIVETGKI